MGLNQQLEKGKASTGSELNTSSSSTDEQIAGVLSPLAKQAVRVIVLQTFERDIKPAIEDLFRGVVNEQIELALLKISTNMTTNPGNEASTSIPRKLQLQFRNRIFLPVLTGKKIVGENQTPLEIVLVDILSGQIVNTGSESSAKLEIVVLEEASDDGEVKIVTDKKGKRILQGSTHLNLKEGRAFVSGISFTQNSDWTKNGKYRLQARVVDDGLIARVEGATTEAFPIQDRRSTLYKKHYPPSLSDKVYHLAQISRKGEYYKRLKGAKINTVKEFLTLLFKDQKQLQDILKLKASSKNWEDLVKHAQTCDGMFLALDPGYEQKTGVVFDAKKTLKGLVIEAQYIPTDKLSAEQKEKAQESVMSEQFENLESFKDETSLQEYLLSDIGFNSLPSPSPGLGISQGVETIVASPQVIDSPLDRIQNLNNVQSSATGESPNHLNMVTSDAEQRNERVPLDDELASLWYQSPCRPPNYIYECSSSEAHFEPANHDAGMLVMTRAVSINRARTRWTIMSIFLRFRNKIKRTGILEGIPAQKKRKYY